MNITEAKKSSFYKLGVAIRDKQLTEEQREHIALGVELSLLFENEVAYVIDLPKKAFDNLSVFQSALKFDI